MTRLRFLMACALLSPLGEAALAQQSASRTFAAAPSTSAAAGSVGELRVKVGPELRYLSYRIEDLDRVEVVEDGRYDVAVESQSDGLAALYGPTGERIAGGLDPRAPRLMQNIARLAGVRRLLDLTYPHQRFDVDLDLPGGHAPLSGEQRFEITARSDRPAFLLLLNIDQTGVVSVLYPTGDQELQPTSGLRESFEAIAPFGIEHLKLFAFRGLPEELSHWLDRRIDALDPDFDQFLHLLREPGVDVAQARLEVVTVNPASANP